VPTSKALLQYLQRHGTVPTIVVQPSGWSDPTLLAGEMIHADAAALCEALLEAADGDAAVEAEWLREWRAAAASREQGGGPLVLAIGDLALYHDMNGLLAGKLHELDATIVVINNDGGGIFSFLPQASEAAHFERLFGTPHGLDFAPAAQLYGACYRRVDDATALTGAVGDGIARRGVHLIELRTDRVRNVVLHREAWAAVATALESR
jgi:2-succinyl-5-enolpyruvyl-6-hydroxy-3-cyclohexene-1-carboxylate synthase